MTTSHTPGRLEVAPCGDDDYAASIHQIDGDPYSFAVGDVFTKEDARRLVACWNLLEGVPTERIEESTDYGSSWGRCGHELASMTVRRDDLLEALKDARRELAYAARQEAHDKACAAIAKAEGKA